jgi:hypothetical protein
MVLRYGASVLLGYTRRAAGRNRAIVRAAADDVASRRLERQLRRISEQVDRDLGEYPSLHRALSEQVTRIDADHRHAGDTPPTPPAWLDAIAAVASINANNDPAVAAILKDMHSTLESSCHDALLEYRAANRRRFHGLRRMQPYFRRIAAMLEELQRRLERLTAHARTIDGHMAAFEALKTARHHSIRRLQFELHLRAAGGLALFAIAGFAALLSHRLIAQPLQLLLSDTPGSSDWTSTTALILIALALGVWIAEVTGLTRLLGIAAQLNDRQRRRLALAGGSLLLALALLQAMLAWSAYSSADVPAMPGPAWLAPLIAALLAAMLPFVIALAAAPLEMVMHSLPAIVGGLLAGSAYLAALMLRLLAATVAALPSPLKKLYDLWIFLPLWCEQTIQAVRSRTAEAPPPPRSEAGENS